MVTGKCGEVEERLREPGSVTGSVGKVARLGKWRREVFRRPWEGYWKLGKVLEATTSLGIATSFRVVTEPPDKLRTPVRYGRHPN